MERQVEDDMEAGLSRVYRHSLPPLWSLFQQWYRRRQKDPKRMLAFSLGFSVKGLILSLCIISDGCSASSTQPQALKRHEMPRNYKREAKLRL